MKRFDIVKIRSTSAIGTVIEVHGHHVTVKCDTLSLPAEVFLMDELELIESDTVSEWQKLCGGKIS